VVSTNTAGGETPLTGHPDRPDAESAEWIRLLSDGGSDRDMGLARLHELLVRVAQREVHRRRSSTHVTGPELDDLAYQAAGDAMVAVTSKLGQFRGDSRFTTWAFKFVMLEVSSKLGRHFWKGTQVPYEAEDWDRIPDRFGIDPADEAQGRDLIEALQRAVEEELTERQRSTFVALVINGVPLDALAAELGSNRNAIYQTIYAARRKLRAALVASGHLDGEGQ
jgi:RNA polymerase sigma-70 factor (ECF subfamily)